MRHNLNPKQFPQNNSFPGVIRNRVVDSMKTVAGGAAFFGAGGGVVSSVMTGAFNGGTLPRLVGMAPGAAIVGGALMAAGAIDGYREGKRDKDKMIENANREAAQKAAANNTQGQPK